MKRGRALDLSVLEDGCVEPGRLLGLLRPWRGTIILSVGMLLAGAFWVATLYLLAPLVRRYGALRALSAAFLPGAAVAAVSDLDRVVARAAPHGRGARNVLDAHGVVAAAHHQQRLARVRVPTAAMSLVESNA